MANSTPSRLGQINGTGDATAIFLKKFSGETMVAFQNTTIMRPRTMVRTITAGKSAQFPTIGSTVASYHTAGAELTGKTIKHDEKTLIVDNQLVSDVFIDELDEMMAHYEFRGPYSKMCGEALGQAWDRQVISMAVKACRDTGTGGTGKGAAGQGDAVSAEIGATPTVQNIIDALFDAAAVFDIKNQPKERFAVVSAATWWDLVTNDKIMNRWYSTNSGSYNDGVLPNIAGFQIVQSNNLQLDHTAAGNLAIAPDYNSKYAVDATDTLALCFNKAALGTVMLKDLSVRIDYDNRRLGDLLVAKYAVGHGVLRPEGLYEIRKDAA